MKKKESEWKKKINEKSFFFVLRKEKWKLLFLRENVKKARIVLYFSGASRRLYCPVTAVLFKLCFFAAVSGHLYCLPSATAIKTRKMVKKFFSHFSSLQRTRGEHRRYTESFRLTSILSQFIIQSHRKWIKISHWKMSDILHKMCHSLAPTEISNNFSQFFFSENFIYRQLIRKIYERID